MGVKSVLEAARRVQEEKKRKEGIKRDFATESSRLEAQVAAGDITQADALKQISQYVKDRGAEDDTAARLLAGGLDKRWGEAIRANQVADVTESLAELSSQLVDQLGAAETESLGFLEAGAAASKEALAAGKEEGLGRLAAGETAAIGEIEAGRGRLQDLAGQTKADVQAQIEAGVAEAGAAVAPWKAAGEEALGKYKEALGMGGDGAALQGLLESMPGYQFRLQTGLKAAERIQSARGGAVGGRALQELQQVGSGIASDEFGRYVGGLRDIAGMGLTAAQTEVGATTSLRGQGAVTLANLGTAFAGMEASLTSQAANVRQTTQTQAAALITDVAGREAMLESSVAGMKANLKMGSAQNIAQTAGNLGMQAAGVTSNFYSQAFSADTQKEISRMQMDFQKSMAEWEAKMAKRAAESAGMYGMFGAVIGGAAQIGAASLLA